MDNPSDIPRWLTRSSTSSSTPLQRILSAIRPLVLPKLREENERARGSKTKKKKGATKDTVVGEDFEVSVFLTERGAGGGGSVGHAVCVRSREMKGEGGGVVEIAEEEDEEEARLGNIPAEQGEGRVEVKRQDGTEGMPVDLRDGEGEEEDDGDDEEEAFERDNPMTSTQRRRVARRRDGEGEDEKKKKGAFDTTYEGFSIYGRILCLVVKRRGTGAKGGRELAGGAGQAMMEEWIGTQIRQHDDEGTEAGEG